MSKTLGPGVRVWIGWACLPGYILNGSGDPRLQQGTITGGPLPAGRRFKMPNGQIGELKRTSWMVAPDDLGQQWAIAEYLLTPIDDDPGEPVERGQIIEETA